MGDPPNLELATVSKKMGFAWGHLKQGELLLGSLLKPPKPYTLNPVLTNSHIAVFPWGNVALLKHPELVLCEIGDA